MSMNVAVVTQLTMTEEGINWKKINASESCIVQKFIFFLRVYIVLFVSFYFFSRDVHIYVSIKTVKYCVQLVVI